MAIPPILAACAHQPPGASAPAGLAATPKKIVYHVRRNKPANSEPEDVGAFDGSPIKSASLPSDVVIIENILSRNMASAEAEKANARQRLRAKVDRTPTRALKPAGGLRAWPGKLGKDGLWDLVRSQLLLASVEHERVSAQIEKFQQHPGQVNFLTRRAEPFLRLIAAEINRRNLPMDLVLVPMVESAFDPAAVSPKQAAGLWQIIPSTGAEHGLIQTAGYDARHDVYASTEAALQYLRHLEQRFDGDWLLALAAYNAGEGTVQRAMEANRKAGKGSDFWHLDLPSETEAYVPKIVALAHLIADPASYGLKLRQTTRAPVMSRVEVSPEISLAEAMAASRLSPEEFYRLNPAFKPGLQSPPQTYQLLLPQQQAEALTATLAGVKLISPRTIRVKKGDTLARIAKRHGVPTTKLALWNKLSADSPLKPGQELLIPV